MPVITVFAIKVRVKSVTWDSLRVSLLCSITVAHMMTCSCHRESFTSLKTKPMSDLCTCSFLLKQLIKSFSFIYQLSSQPYHLTLHLLVYISV